MTYPRIPSEAELRRLYASPCPMEKAFFELAGAVEFIRQEKLEDQAKPVSCEKCRYWHVVPVGEVKAGAA
ncbi:hypothetical protein ABZ215_33490 [Amycolatopsis sp. NPDC006131]|uniref:hypothetical protein n=1 Tax=Amycolatopsis sp. NPDC006131 TaxID=3156731 RepID=UPI00339F62FA